MSLASVSVSCAARALGHTPEQTGHYVMQPASATRVYSGRLPSEDRTYRYLPGLLCIADGWITISPICLVTEQDDDGEYLVTDTFSTVYGSGDSVEKAIADYRLSLMDYYDLLAQGRAQSVDAALRLNRMEQYIRRIPAAHAP